MRRSRLIFVVSLLVAISVLPAAIKSGDIYFQIKKQLTIFSDVYKEIVTLYVDELPPGALMKSGINSMLDALDPYTTFVDEGQQQQMEILTTGTYGGIGLDAGFRGERIVVIAPYDGYPASRAGIRPGDFILEIDGVSTDGMDPEEVQQLTIGDIGTPISLKIERRGIDQPLEFELERERIEVKNIAHSDLIGEHSDVGYIQLTRFGQNTAEELREQLLRFREESNMKGLILDLRNNPGGLLNEAVHVVDKFIDPGELVVETRGRLREQSNSFYTEEPPLFDDLPMVILLNSGSASASEVVAGALQDLDRAVILGQTSFGKGLVQTMRPLSYNTSLRLTVSRYYTPSGRSIQSIDYTRDNGSAEQLLPEGQRREFETRNGRKVYEGAGIEPDITIEEPSVSLLETTIQKKNLAFFFISDYISDHSVDEESELPENIYQLFVEYLQEEDIDFETSADRHLKELKNSDAYFSETDKARELIRELEQLVNEQKKLSLMENREQLENALKLEWISVTRGGAEKIQESLPLDLVITESLSILSNPERYKEVLSN
jgi:carboxyl-terminal processing protease